MQADLRATTRNTPGGWRNGGSSSGGSGGGGALHKPPPSRGGDTRENAGGNQQRRQATGSGPAAKSGGTRPKPSPLAYDALLLQSFDSTVAAAGESGSSWLCGGR